MLDLLFESLDKRLKCKLYVCSYSFI